MLFGMSFLAECVTYLVSLFVPYSADADLVLNLYEQIIGIAIVLLYCRFAERRPLSSMGYVKRGAVSQYLSGLGVGFAMFAAVVGLGTVLGGFRFEGFTDSFRPGILLLFLGGFLFQGMFEEAMCRGYIMVSLARKNSVLLAVIVNASIFGLMHAFNPGFGPLPVVNLVLFGFFASVYMLRTGNIWGVAAIHSIWNFVQGNFFGLSVSGMPLMPTVFRFSSTDNALISGGDFGPEGGLPVTVVLVVGIALVLLVPKKGKEQIRTEAR